jgi:hypothetical protein
VTYISREDFEKIAEDLNKSQNLWAGIMKYYFYLNLNQDTRKLLSTLYKQRELDKDHYENVIEKLKEFKPLNVDWIIRVIKILVERHGYLFLGEENE